MKKHDILPDDMPNKENFLKLADLLKPYYELRPHREEVVPDNIKYIKDTLENREILKNKFGGKHDMFGLYDNQFSYIKFNTQTKEWTPSLDFEWLYRNPPILTPIEEIIK